ncbi:MAG: hypothetical protein KF764_31715 [Labilithrix sp.]|nr:hypothetical protein [Labilithrix sp.]
MSRLALSTLGLAGVVLVAFVACADTEPGDAAPPRDDADGGGLPPPSDGGDAGDAPDDDDDVDAAPRECSKEGFCHTKVPPKQTLRGVWSDGAGATWAVSAEGAILRYDGKSWSVHTTELGELFSIWGSGPTDVWVGGDGVLFHGQGETAATLTFTSMKLPGPPTPMTSIWGTGADDVWAAGGVNGFPLLGRLLHFTGAPGKDDAGPEWSLEDFSRDSIWLTRVFGSKASGVWAAGVVQERVGWFLRRRVVVLRRSVGSADFVEVDLPRDPAFPDETTGNLERLFDASASADGLSMWVLGKTEGSLPAYLKGTSSDGGQTFSWTFGATGGSGGGGDPALNAIGAVSANEAYIVGDYGRLRRWNGQSWKQSVVSITKYPLTTPLYALGGHGSDLWFVGEGVALHRDPSKVQP